MFVGSCINVKVESLKSSERFNFYIYRYTQPFVHYLYFIYAWKFHSCMHVKLRDSGNLPKL